MEATSADVPHFLLLPYTEQGHITPMLSLASQLAAMECKVTFVKTAKHPEGARNLEDQSLAWKSSNGSSTHRHTNVDNDTRAAESLLQFVTLSQAHSRCESAMNFVSMSSRHFGLKKTLAELEERQGLVEEIVQDSKASANPISCIICDFFLWKWVKKLASRQGLNFAVLAPFSALALYTFYLGHIGKDSESEELLVSGFGMPKKDDPRRYGVANVRDPPEVKKQKITFFSSLLEGIEEANAPILVNSFKQLEAPLLPSLESSGLDVRFIGPCLPAWNKSVGIGNKMAQKAGSAFVEDEACLQWLDRQENQSVLLVSFGSEGIVEEEQVEEIAMGIEMSGHKFMWVVRPNAPASSLPPVDFRKRNSEHGNERGLFVSWVPQRRVLQHPAVGGFLTHSGWNSTLESVTFGVPMLCVPLIGDQPFNANLVERHWRVGMRLLAAAATSSQDGGPLRHVVERGVRALIEGHFSQQAAELQQAAWLAIQDVRQTLASFVHDIKTIKTNGR